MQIDNNTSFNAVIAQEHVRRILQKALANDHIAHAYLFTGPDGVGRLNMAIELARVLSCERDPVESAVMGCDCISCNNMRRLQHPNLTLLFPLPSTGKSGNESNDKGRGKSVRIKQEELAAEAYKRICDDKAADPYSLLSIAGSGLIRIEQIRELRNRMVLTMDRRGIRVVIIQPADHMNIYAANALLKLLEEPPDRCCLILIANSTRSMPPTIVSRCQIVSFSALPIAAIANDMQLRRSVSIETAESVARLAGGNYAYAILLLEESMATQLDESLNFLRAAVTGHTEKISAFIDEWGRSKSKQEIVRRLNYIAIWLKDALVTGSFADEEVQTYLSTTDRQDIIQKIAFRYQTDQLCSAWRETEEARLDIDSNAIPALVLTAFALKIHRIFNE